MIIAIGFDPGSKWTGVGIVSREHTMGLSFRFVAAFESNNAALRDALVQGKERGATVAAIERPSGHIHEHVRGAQLLATADVGGGIAGMALEMGFGVFKAAAQDVRRALCGRMIARRVGGGVAGDGVVRRVLPLLVRDLPMRMNSHERDALMVAVLALLNPRSVMRNETIKVDPASETRGGGQ